MSLARMMNKTPLFNEKSRVYEISGITQETIQKIIQSRFIGEGVYGMEQFSMPNYFETYTFAPSFDLQGTDIQKQWDFKNENLNDLSFYELRLEKPMFMPLNTKQFVDLLNALTELSQGTVFTQILLCKRMDNWRETAINQYETYLKGNDNPLNSKLAIRVQEKMLGALKKISNFTVRRDPIEEMEQKILLPNYRFECRFIVFEDKQKHSFVANLEKSLQKLHFFNELSLKKVKNNKYFLKFIENREFQSDLVNQILSEYEIYSLLSNGRPASAVKVELEKPVKTQNVMKKLDDNLLLQQAIQLMPLKEKRKVSADNGRAQQLNNAFKRVGIVKQPLKIMEIQQGSSILKVQMEIPPEITHTTVTKKLFDIQGAMGDESESISIEIGDKPDTINVFLPLDEKNRDALYFRNVIETPEFQEFRKNNILPFIIGENVRGGFLFADLTKLRHILIAGTTGSGKSVFINLIILCLLLCVPPDELILYLIDPKLVEFTQFKGLPQVRDVITDMKKASATLKSLCLEMDSRYEKLAEASCRDIQGYNETQNEKMNYIVCVIDELSDLMMIAPGDIEDYIVRLSQKARGAGIHLIIATQRPSVDVITGLIKANLPNRFAFSVVSSTDSKTILDKGGAEKLLGMGDGLAKLEGNKREFERFQSPILTTDKKQEGSIFEGLKGLFKDVTPINTELPEMKVESDIDKLKRIIATTGELKVSELGRLMEIGNNKVHALMQELVDEDWLLHEGKGRPYEINVDEEELNRWRE